MRKFLVRRASVVLFFGVAILILGGWFGLGLFKNLGGANDNFFADDTPAAQTNAEVRRIFGDGEAEQIIVLFESKNRSGDVTSTAYAAEATKLLDKLGAKSIHSYYTTGADQFVSRDKRDTYAVVALDGDKTTQYDTATAFAKDARSDVFDVSLGGSLVGQQQTQEQAKTDLEHAELISLPILALLLFWFFRSPIAAAVPLVMSGLTIAGALAVARLIHYVVPIDTYTLNVITILGVGLSIDYSLLMVNRFRDELHAKKAPDVAAEKTQQTAGRTVFFSGLTVMVCLLSLLLFPVGFMKSVSIGGAASVAVAVFISVVLLPPALKLMGKTIDKWSIKQHKTLSKGWHRLAVAVTKRPVMFLIAGIVGIAALVWPVKDFAVKSFDWHVLPSNQSAYHVGKVMDERFAVKAPTVTILAHFDRSPSVAQVCQLAQTAQNIDGVESVQGAYVPTVGQPDCAALPYVLEGLKMQSPELAAVAAKQAAQYVKGNYAVLHVVSQYDPNDGLTKTLLDRIRNASYGDGVTLRLSGEATRSQETMDVYVRLIPVAVMVVVLAMVVVLSLSLGSFVIPLQAVIVNSLALFISLGVLIMVFQYGWLANVLHMNVSGGFGLSIPILIFVIAFGLSMDYAVFLYSRIHELYDTSGDAHQAIVEGVAKTGPIITSAALLMFVVVASFALSHIAIIQQIGLGLAVAVLVDAFFVRIVFVPAVMQLFGRASWWGPVWLKRITIKHE